jgi:hypothetical protein
MPCQWEWLVRFVPQLPANVNGDSITVRISYCIYSVITLGAARIALTDFSPGSANWLSNHEQWPGKVRLVTHFHQDMTHRWFATTLAKTGLG